MYPRGLGFFVTRQEQHLFQHLDCTQSLPAAKASTVLLRPLHAWLNLTQVFSAVMQSHPTELHTDSASNACTVLHHTHVPKGVDTHKHTKPASPQLSSSSAAFSASGCISGTPAASSGLYSDSNSCAICPCASAMLLLMGRNRMARVAGFGRYSCVLATVGGRRSVMAVLTPATSSASLAGAPKA